VFDGKRTDYSMQHAYLLTRVSPQLHTTTKSSQKTRKKNKRESRLARWDVAK